MPGDLTATTNDVSLYDEAGREIGTVLEEHLISIRDRLNDVVVANVSDRIARELGIVSVSNFPSLYDVSDRAGRALGVISGTVGINNFPAVQATDVTDRAARILGRIEVTNFPATQATDVTDREARLLGVINNRVRNASGAWTNVGFGTGDVSMPITVQNTFVVADRRRTSNTSGPQVTSMSSSASAVLVPANPNRLAVTIQNNTTGSLYIAYGAPATAATGLVIPANSYSLREDLFTGAIHGRLSSPLGTADIQWVEVTA